MRILVLTGIKEELSAVAERHPLSFDRERGLYRSESYPEVYAGTTGPGIPKSGRKQLRRWLRELAPHIIINAGLVGLLREDAPHSGGDRLRLGAVIHQATGVVFPGGAGRGRLVSVSEPVFEPSAKMDLALDHEAIACDMEAAPLLSIVGQTEEITTGSVVLLRKFVGDRPDSYRLFRYEHRIRGWERKGLFEKLWIGLRFPGGPHYLQELLEMKATALGALGDDLAQLLGRLAPLPPENLEMALSRLDSAFIPH